MSSRYWHKPIGQILIEKGLTTQGQLEECLALQQHKPGRKIGEILVSLGYISLRDVRRAYADQLGSAYAKNWVTWTGI
jgi:hypothetical protein